MNRTFGQSYFVALTSLFTAVACGGSENGIESRYGEISVRGERFERGEIETILIDASDVERFAIHFDGVDQLEMIDLASEVSYGTVTIDPASIGSDVVAWNDVTYETWLLLPNSALRESESASSSLGKQDPTSCVGRCRAVPENDWASCYWWCATR
jgi:hypothetical protein